jgi:hypothetical protein
MREPRGHRSIWDRTRRLRATVPGCWVGGPTRPMRRWRRGPAAEWAARPAARATPARAAAAAWKGPAWPSGTLAPRVCPAFWVLAAAPGAGRKCAGRAVAPKAVPPAWAARRGCAKAAAVPASAAARTASAKDDRVQDAMRAPPRPATAGRIPPRPAGSPAPATNEATACAIWPARSASLPAARARTPSFPSRCAMARGAACWHPRSAVTRLAAGQTAASPRAPGTTTVSRPRSATRAAAAARAPIRTAPSPASVPATTALRASAVTARATPPARAVRCPAAGDGVHRGRWPSSPPAAAPWTPGPTDTDRSSKSGRWCVS